MDNRSIAGPKAKLVGAFEELNTHTNSQQSVYDNSVYTAQIYMCVSFGVLRPKSRLGITVAPQRNRNP